MRYAHALGELGARRGIFVNAAEALVDKLFAVLEQISAELPAGPGQVVQGVQIEQASQLRDYAVGASLVSAYQQWAMFESEKGSRITAQCG